MLLKISVNRIGLSLKPSESIAYLLTVPICFFLLGSNVCQAADAFSWTDANGRTIYGSQPPKQAQNVKSLKTNSLSRYSSDKVLKRLGWSEEEQRARLAEQTNQAAEAVEAQEEPLEESLPEPAQLQASAPLVEHNETGDITSCTVEVENSGELSARSVSVSFSFPDGTLIPGVGPEEILANAKASYSVPSELLPFSINNNLDEEPLTETALPSVIIDSEGALVVGK